MLNIDERRRRQGFSRPKRPTRGRGAGSRGRAAFLSGALALALVISTGCATVGPRAIRTSRTDYNMALRQTEDEQLLLNLVRLRYRDRPLFLEATALNTQFSYAPSAEAGVTFGPDVANGYSLGGKIAYEEKPTVTYIPLQGAGYVERIMSAVPVETMVLLDSSGWSTERVFRVCVQRLNGLGNAPRAAGPTPLEAPEYRSFLEVARLLRELELTGGVAGAQKVVDDGSAVVLRFDRRARDTEAFGELTRRLRLDPDAETYVLTTHLDEGGGDRINLIPRSFAGVLSFLSQSVEVPEAHVRAGHVTVTRDTDGNVFDWAEVTEGLMRIRSSAGRPADAAVSVYYRGAWFYIDDSDLDSKSTFSMVAQLYALQAGGSAGLTPVLTLPVGN